MLFKLGSIMSTPGARELIESQSLDTRMFLKRHATGDWGDLSKNDKKENDFSVKEGFRILSAYQTPLGKLWIITEADRSATTFLLPDEY